MRKFLHVSVIFTILIIFSRSEVLANNEEVLIPGLNTAQSDPYLSFTRTSIGNVYQPYLEGNWYSTEEPFSINNSLQVYEGGMSALVYEDQSYSLTWQPNQTKWHLIYGNVTNQAGQGAGIDYNWTAVINAATENNTGIWSSDFVDTTFKKAGTTYNVVYEEETPVVSAPGPIAGGGLLGFILLGCTGLLRRISSTLTV